MSNFNGYQIINETLILNELRISSKNPLTDVRFRRIYNRLSVNDPRRKKLLDMIRGYSGIQ